MPSSPGGAEGGRESPSKIDLVKGFPTSRNYHVIK